MTQLQDDAPHGVDMARAGNNEVVKFLSVRQAATLLNVSPRSVYGWIAQGSIPYRKAGRRVLFIESELVAWTKPNCERRQFMELIER